MISGFAVERSKDARNWTEIGFVGQELLKVRTEAVGEQLVQIAHCLPGCIL